MQSARKNPGKSPEQLRRERAVTEYHACRFTPGTLTIRYKDGEERRVPVVYVASPSGSIYTVPFAAEGAAGCNCQDHQRRGAACKHMLAAEMFITGDVPEPYESLVAALPVPPFDVDAEAGRLASLEAQEARHAAALADRQLWD